MGIEVIQIKEEKTVRKLINELKLPSPFLLELKGEVFYPEDNYDRILKKGDSVTLIPIIAGG